MQEHRVNLAVNLGNLIYFNLTHSGTMPNCDSATAG
jgi:hypothetical protein